MTKITRLNFQKLVVLLTKNRHLVIIAFSMLKLELKFEHTSLAKKG